MATRYETLGPLQTTGRTTTVRSISGADDMDTKLPTSDEFKKLRQMYADLYNKIGQTYINLANAGRANEALQLKEAAERFSRAGSSMGLSPMARAAALTSLQTAMRAAGMQQEAANAAQSLAAQTSTLSSLTGAEQQQFRDEISRYNAALNALPQTTVTTEMQAARPIQDQISTVVKSPTVNRARQALDARLAAASAKPTAMAGPLPTSGGYVAPKTSPVYVAPVSVPAPVAAPISGHANIGEGVQPSVSPARTGGSGTGVLTTADGKQVVLDATGKITVVSPTKTVPAPTALSAAVKKGYEALPTSWMKESFSNMPSVAYSPIRKAGEAVTNVVSGFGNWLGKAIYGN